MSNSFFNLPTYENLKKLLYKFAFYINNRPHRHKKVKETAVLVIKTKHPPFKNHIRPPIENVSISFHIVQDYERLNSEMLHSLEKQFTSDDHTNGDTASSGWNKLFIKVK